MNLMPSLLIQSGLTPTHKEFPIMIHMIWHLWHWLAQSDYPNVILMLFQYLSWLRMTDTRPAIDECSSKCNNTLSMRTVHAGAFRNNHKGGIHHRRQAVMARTAFYQNYYWIEEHSRGCSMMSRLFRLFSARCPPAHSPTVSFGTTVCKVCGKHARNFSDGMNSMTLVIPFHFMKKDSKRCCDTTTPDSILTKDESKRGSAFAFIFGVNWPVQWM